MQGHFTKICSGQQESIKLHVPLQEPDLQISHLEAKNQNNEHSQTNSFILSMTNATMAFNTNMALQV